MNAKTSLKAMAADPSDSQVKKTDLWKVDPRRLTEIDGFNLRDYDDPDVIAQPVDRFGKIDGRSTALVIVTTDQGEQRRGDRRQVDRVGREQRELDRLQSPGPQFVEVGLAVPSLPIAHATSSKSRRSRFTFPQR